MSDKTRLLFICLGNICRSPAANAIMQHIVDEAGLASQFEIDSAGIGPWHVGQLPDSRMRKYGQPVATASTILPASLMPDTTSAGSTSSS